MGRWKLSERAFIIRSAMFNCQRLSLIICLNIDSNESATGDQWRNISRKKEETEPKQKQHPVVDVTGDRSKVQSCKEQYRIGTWNVRSINQGKLEVAKQEMARVNVKILCSFYDSF